MVTKITTKCIRLVILFVIFEVILFKFNCQSKLLSTVKVDEKSVSKTWKFVCFIELPKVT